MDSVLTEAIVAPFAQPTPDAVHAPESGNTAAPSAIAT